MLSVRFCAAASAVLLGTCLNVLAQSVPGDVGAVVSGFQDDFDGATLNASWVVRGQSVYSVSGGSLRIVSASGDPNHLLYEAAGYDSSVQEVLARVRVTSFGSGDGPRCGISAAVSSASSQGINYFFRNEPSAGQYHMEFLDDARAWGPEQAFVWQLNTWYWLRLRHDPNASAMGGVNDVFGKIWLADGAMPEPANWQHTWDYIPTRTARSGYAGLAASSAGGLAEYEVDYILIKASGLPSITVAPRAFVQTAVTITNQPQNQVVEQCRIATFTVGATGNPQPTFQWQKGTANIPWGTNAMLVISNASAADAGSYRVIAANVVTGVTVYATSSVATLTVGADSTAPAALAAQSLGLTQVQVSFSEAMSTITANDAVNYSITNLSGPVVVNSSSLDVTRTNVVLTCATMVEGSSYTLVMRNLSDGCAANPIAQNSTLQFTASSYAAAAIGTSTPEGAVVPVAGGYDVSGGGTGIGGTADQFQFAWQQRSGDFDIKVRVASLALTDAWARAGLMVRENLEPGSRSVAAMATPTISGCFFQARTTANGATLTSGSFPANYPHTWLRLKRAGNNFTGYAGYDGESWVLLGTAGIVMPANLLFGFAVSSQIETELTTAAFRDLETVTVTNKFVSEVEPLAQSSRRTSLVISEIMYHPRTRADGRKGEFVELFNALAEPQDISGFRLSGEVDYTFPSNTIVPAGGFVVVARVPADLQAIHGITGVHGPFAGTNSLSNQSGTIRLRHRTGAVLLEANYSSAAPYPASAGGAGHSLVLARPSFGERDARAWAASDAVGGSPGRLDPVTVDPLRSVVINEFMANTDLPAVDYLELYNRSAQSLDLSGCTLSDDPGTNKFTIPQGTTIPAHGFLVFYETNLNFALGAKGESIIFRNAAGTRVIDAVSFGPQQLGVASGRSPNGTGGFERLAAGTPGASNAAPRLSDIVINEIMYHPISENSDDEYVELHNRGTNSVDLYQWKLSDGIEYTFNTHVIIASGGYVVVAKNRTNLMVRYAGLNPGNTVGNFGGSLANSGERIALSMPDFELATNALGVTTNISHVVVNEITYGDGGRWGEWADGGGSSLELMDARADNRLASNWADSDESAKAPWTVASFTGILDHPHSAGIAADRLEMFLQGSGECVIDDIEVLDQSQVNRVSNSSFQSGATGWTAEGTQDKSSLDSTGGYSGQGYRVRAIDRGDNQVNRIRTVLTSGLASGSRATLRAKVRWVRGHPEFLLRLRGGWLEMPVTMTLPTNLGTPGARNSRALNNAGPAIADVKHSPVLPAASEPVVVSARVSDPDGLASVQLRYRLDPSATYQTITMNDAGTNGDPTAGDGVFSCILPGQLSGGLVAYYVQASDGSSTTTFPNNAPQREGLVRFGEVQPYGSFPTYRIWMTQSTFNTWSSRHKLNNTPLNVAFVLGNSRVIYNAQALYAGSPYISPGYNTPSGNRCGYTIAFPKDDPFLGSTDLVLDWPGGHGNEPTAIQEQMAYWIADRMNIEFSHRHFIHLHVNGVRDDQRGGIYEAVMQPASEFINQWSNGDEDGDFYKIDRGFEFDDSGNRLTDPMPTLQSFMTTNVETGQPEKKTARYRFTWMKRAFTSANNYTNIFALVDAVNGAAYEPYTSQTLGLVDVEQWTRMFAFEHAINNFDSYGHDIGKNMYAYKPQQGRWVLYAFDLDWLMLVSANSASYGVNAGLFNVNDPVIGRMYNHPPFRRAMWRAYQEIVDGPLLNSEADPVMDAKHAALVQNGVTQSEGGALQSPAALKTWWTGRRNYIVSQLQAQNASFGITSASTITSSSNLVQISGTAPYGVETIYFNGVPYAVTWTAQNAWTARIPVGSSTNVVIRGYDSAGQPITGASNMVTVNITAPVEMPAGNLVINELMYLPGVPGAEFIELFNAATNTAFDLSGMRVNGIDYAFPSGSSISARSFLVLARNRSVFSLVYGAAVPVFGEFAGDLQQNGETVSLMDRFGSVIDRVRYETTAPWPAVNGSTASLQLVDARQDTERAGNWAAANATPAAANSVATVLPAFPPLWINEVQAENTSGIMDNRGERQPWIEIYNSGSNTVSLAGLYLSSSYTNLAHWAFPAGASIGAKQFLVVFCDEYPERTSNTQYHTSFRLSPGSGSAALSRLHNGQPQVIDFVNYSGLRADRSVGSAPDGQPIERMEFFYVTPGAANDLRSAPLTVFVNEWMSSNTRTVADPADGDYDDWFELYNPSTNSVDLAGFYLTDVLTNKTKFRITTNMAHVIAPMGYLLVWADDETGQNTAAGMIRPDLHVNFQLSKSGEAIGLFAADGTQIDAVTFGAQADDVSSGRIPDGSVTITSMPGTASPRAANYLPNTPPVLEPIAKRSAYVGEQVSFTAMASDANLHSISFSLSGEPAGAAIHSVSGVFTWVPGAAGTYSFQVIVTDTGIPPASAQRTAEIDVLPLPELGGIHREANAVALTWSTVSGRSYVVEFKDDLSAPEWMPLGTNTATGTTLSFTNAVNGSNQRFFRVRAIE